VKRPGLLHGTALNFADGAISLASGVVVTVLLARALKPGGFGLYALVMSIVSFSFLFARMGIPGTVRRYAAELDSRGEHHLIGTITGRGLVNGLAAGIVAALLLIALAAPLGAFFHQPQMPTYLLIGALLIPPMVVLSVLRGLLGGLQQFRFMMQVNLVTGPIWLVACAWALWIQAGVVGILLATLGVELINVGAFAWRAQHQVGLRWQATLPAEFAARLRRYNLGLAALILLDVIVWQRSELLFLGRFQPATQVSFYALPFALTERITDLIPGAMLGVLLPGLTYAQASADPSRFGVVFRDALRYLAILTLPISVVGILVAPWIVRLLYGPGFKPATVVLQILLTSIVFGVLGQAGRSALLGFERQGLLLKTGVIAAVLSILLDLLLIPRWGAIGAALANTAVQATWAIAIFIPVWRRIRVRPTPSLAEAVASS
jgi:O-antigen/teichoic acid export membrane protein